MIEHEKVTAEQMQEFRKGSIWQLLEEFIGEQMSGAVEKMSIADKPMDFHRLQGCVSVYAQMLATPEYFYDKMVDDEKEKRPPEPKEKGKVSRLVIDTLKGFGGRVIKGKRNQSEKEK